MIGGAKTGMWVWNAVGSCVTSNVCTKANVSIFIFEDEFLSPKEYCMPGINAGIWLARAPGKTSTSSFSKEKQSCLVLMLFSFICRWTAFTINGTCCCNNETGPSSSSIASGSSGTPVAGLVCLNRAMYAWKISDFTFSSLSAIISNT